MNHIDVNICAPVTHITLGCEDCPRRKTLRFNMSGIAVVSGIDSGNVPIVVEEDRPVEVYDDGKLINTSPNHLEMRLGRASMGLSCPETQSCENAAEMELLESAYINRNRSTFPINA